MKKTSHAQILGREALPITCTLEIKEGGAYIGRDSQPHQPIDECGFLVLDRVKRERKFDLPESLFAGCRVIHLNVLLDALPIAPIGQVEEMAVGRLVARVVEKLIHEYRVNLWLNMPIFEEVNDQRRRCINNNQKKVHEFFAIRQIDNYFKVMVNDDLDESGSWTYWFFNCPVNQLTDVLTSNWTFDVEGYLLTGENSQSFEERILSARHSADGIKAIIETCLLLFENSNPLRIITNKLKLNDFLPLGKDLEVKGLLDRICWLLESRGPERYRFFPANYLWERSGRVGNRE